MPALQPYLPPKPALYLHSSHILPLNTSLFLYFSFCTFSSYIIACTHDMPVLLYVHSYLTLLHACAFTLYLILLHAYTCILLQLIQEPFTYVKFILCVLAYIFIFKCLKSDSSIYKKCRNQKSNFMKIIKKGITMKHS